MTFDRTRQRGLPVWLPVLAAALIVARVVSTYVPQHATVDLVNWTMIGQASQRAQRMHRPILYEFSAAWCQPCKKLKEDVFMDPQLARTINDRYVAVAVVDRQAEDGRNTAEVQQLMDRFGVRAFPTVVLVDLSGRELDRVVGYPGRHRFVAMLERPH